MRISLLVFALALPTIASAGPQQVAKQQARVEGRVLQQLERTTSRPGVQQQATDRYLDRYGHLDIRRVRKIEAWSARLPAADVPAEVELTPKVSPPPPEPPPEVEETPAE